MSLPKVREVWANLSGVNTAAEKLRVGPTGERSASRGFCLPMGGGTSWAHPNRVEAEVA